MGGYFKFHSLGTEIGRLNLGFIESLYEPILNLKDPQAIYPYYVL